MSKDLQVLWKADKTIDEGSIHCGSNHGYLRARFLHQCWFVGSPKNPIPFDTQAHPYSALTVQASCRALIVDSLPTQQQQIGSAWGMYREAYL